MRPTSCPSVVLCLILLLVVVPLAAAKRGRTLHTEAEMAQMRANIAQFAWAQAQVRSAVEAAEPWVKLSDQELWDYFPAGTVPRSVLLNRDQGCPIHGTAIFEGRGFYPWKRDPAQPYRVQCPIGGEWYPSNDFAALLAEAGDKGTRGLVDTHEKYNDDGWGYVDEEGHRYWFVAYCNQWLWHDRRAVPGLLSRAYLLTGDAKYAHKAAVALARLATIYPGMHYAEQCDGVGGTVGRILYGQWETPAVNYLAAPYDDIFPYLATDEDPALTEFLAGKQITDPCHHIEQGLLQEFAKSLQTNTEMVPGVQGSNDWAMALLAAVWDCNDPAQGMTTDQMLDWAWRGLGWNGEALIHNDTYRDGFECEEGLGYNFAMRNQLMHMARLFERAGRSIWGEPKLRKLLDAPLDVVILDRFTPAMGDSGGLPSAGKIGWDPALYALAFQVYHDPRYARVAGSGPVGPEAIFAKDPGAEAARAIQEGGGDQPRQSRNFGGFGLGILERGQGESGRALSLWYGSSGGGHSHRDRLNVELWANGASLAPDFGYPEHWGSPRNLQWVSNTASHNTVVVDSSGQLNAGWNGPGSGYLTLFKRSPALDLIEAEGGAAYGAPVSQYRRLCALIDTPAGGYTFDLFRVRGGGQHDYLFHGGHADFSFAGADLSLPDTKGTVAGPDVAPEAPVEGPLNGFQFLYNPQRTNPPGAWSGTWKLRDKDSGLRLTMLPDCAQEVVIADGDPPWHSGGPVKFIVARNRGADLSSNYAAVLEPFRGQPGLRVSRLRPREADPALVAARVQGPDVDHTILCSPVEAADKRRGIEGGVTLAAQFGFISQADGAVQTMVLANGTELTCGQTQLRASGPIRGRITSADYRANAVVVDQDLSAGSALVGETVVFGNDKRHSNYEIKGVEKRPEGWAILLGDTITDVCQCEASEIDPANRTIKTETPILLYTNGMEFPGMSFVNEARTAACRVEAFEAIGRTGVNVPPFGGIATLGGGEDLQQTFTDANGDGRTEFYVYEFGPGDSFEIANSAHAERLNPWAYRLTGTGRTTLTVPVEGPGETWVKLGAAAWTKADTGPSAAGTCTVTLDPARDGTGQALVAVARPEWLDLDDRESPVIEKLLADGREVADAGTIELGRLSEFREVSLDLSDARNPLDPTSISVTLDGRRYTLKDPQLTLEFLSEDKRRARLTCAVPVEAPVGLLGCQAIVSHSLALQADDYAIDDARLTRTINFALVSPPPPHVVYLSDLRPTRVFVHGYMTDRGLNAPDIVLHGVTYARGVFAHPELAQPETHSEIVYDLRTLKEYGTFHAVVGVEDAAGGGSVEFKLQARRGDGEWQELWKSGVLRVGDESKLVECPLEGADELRLYVTDGGDGYGCDHAFWADARLQ